MAFEDTMGNRKAGWLATCRRESREVTESEMVEVEINWGGVLVSNHSRRGATIIVENVPL